MGANQYIGADGVARKVINEYIGVDGVARRVTSGYVGVEGVARLFYSRKAGDLDPGDLITLPVDGDPVDFIVLHQGNPDPAIYDSSCTGTWLLMKGNFYVWRWKANGNAVYSDSYPHSRLNNVNGAYYLPGKFSGDFADAIKEVKLPYYTNGGNAGELKTGADGLSAKIFLLSRPEVNCATGSTGNYSDGICLDYFNGSDDSKRVVDVADNKNGVTDNWWWLRSPYRGNLGRTGYASVIEPYGAAGEADISLAKESGIRPAMIIEPGFVFPQGTVITKS